MIIKGSYCLTYTVDGHQEELLVEIELKPIKEILKSYQNVYYGTAYVNGLLYLEKDLSHIVNAKFAAEDIGIELRDEMKKKLRKLGKSFRLKKEEIK